jgi:hypothetical protein
MIYEPRTYTLEPPEPRRLAEVEKRHAARC